uniref:WD repeat-containing protein 89 n=1 Tax=Steinernema glaseri TaxID=37863 RepID=A0A1I8AB06_9BILA
MENPFFSWYPGPSSAVVTAIRELPDGLESRAKWIVVENEETKATVYMLGDGLNAKPSAKIIRNEAVKVVDAVFCANLWKIVILYEDFALHLVEPANGRVVKKTFLKRGLNKDSVATAFAMRGVGPIVAVGYTLDQSVPKAERKKNKKKYEDYDEEDAIMHCIDLIDIRSPEVPEKTYEDLHSSTIQSLNFCPTAPNILLTGGADGLVNWVDVDVTTPEDGLMATNSVVSPVSTVGFVGNDSEGKTLAYGTTDDGRSEFYRMFHSNKPEEFDVEVTFQRSPPKDSNRFLVDIIGSGDERLPFVTVESSEDGQVTMTATSTDGKQHQDLGTFKGHKELVRCVFSDTAQRRIVTGDDAGGAIGRCFKEVRAELIQDTVEEMEESEGEEEAAKVPAKKKSRIVKKKLKTKNGKVVKKKAKKIVKKKTKKSV